MVIIKIPNNSSPSLTSLKPGALVNATVKKILDSGLQCTFCGIFNANIDLFNLSTEKPIEKLYKEKQKVKIDIVILIIYYIDMYNKINIILLKYIKYYYK